MKYILLILLCSLKLYTESMTLDFENDTFFGEDIGYTNGLKLSKSSAPSGLFNWALPYEPKEDKHSILQYMYTPDDISDPKPIIGDRPYAGVLAYEFMTRTTDILQRRYYGVGVQLGVTGDYSFAEEAQTKVHEWTDSTIPQGWDNQVPNAPHLNLFYIYKQKVLHTPYYDLAPGVSGSVGSNTQLNANLNFRIGHNIPQDFILINEPVPQINNWSIYGFVGGSVTLVLYNHYLDSSVSTVESESVVLTGNMGLIIRYKNIETGFTAIARSQEYNTEDIKRPYGVVSLTYHF